MKLQVLVNAIEPLTAISQLSLPAAKSFKVMRVLKLASPYIEAWEETRVNTIRPHVDEAGAVTDPVKIREINSSLEEVMAEEIDLSFTAPLKLTDLGDHTLSPVAVTNLHQVLFDLDTDESVTSALSRSDCENTVVGFISMRNTLAQKGDALACNGILLHKLTAIFHGINNTLLSLTDKEQRALQEGPEAHTAFLNSVQTISLPLITFAELETYNLELSANELVILESLIDPGYV